MTAENSCFCFNFSTVFEKLVSAQKGTMGCTQMIVMLRLYLMRCNEAYTGELYKYPSHPLQQFSENYILPDSTIFSDNTTPVSYGQLTFYNNFITCYRNILKKQKISYSSSGCKNWLSISILLCGDIHPCPGPVSNRECSSSPSSSQYRMFNNRGLHFIHINPHPVFGVFSHPRRLIFAIVKPPFDILHRYF